MADTPRLDTPHVLVTMQDGTEHDVRTENPDMVRFDLERARRKWPGIADAPFLWLSFLAWSALKRHGVIGDQGFDDWLALTSKIDNVDADGQLSDDVETAVPTRPGADPG